MLGRGIARRRPKKLRRTPRKNHPAALRPLVEGAIAAPIP